MITEEDHRNFVRMSELYDEMMKIFKPYSDKYEFIRMYRTSDHPIVKEYITLRDLYVNKPIQKIKKIPEVEICTVCKKDIGKTFHMEGANPECMKCYCTRII